MNVVSESFSFETFIEIQDFGSFWKILSIIIEEEEREISIGLKQHCLKFSLF